MLRAGGGSSPIQILGKSAVAVSCPADTTEDTLATVTVPANGPGPNGMLRITSVWSCTSNANNKTMRVRFSGGAGTAYLSLTLTTQAGTRTVTEVFNVNSAAVQKGVYAANILSTASAYGTASSTVDTTAATTLVFTGQKAVAGDTLTLESYLVELIYGA